MPCNYSYTIVGQLKLYNIINRNSFSLPFTERSVLMFILDRTVGWRKVWEYISPPEFIDGVKRRRKGQDIVMVGGTNLALDQLNEALTRLEERGAIETACNGRKVRYKIAEYWSHPELHGSGMWELGEGDYEYYEDTDDCDLSPVVR